jgi:hypothetical protein
MALEKKLLKNGLYDKKYMQKIFGRRKQIKYMF